MKFTRLLILEPSLESMLGHHFEYIKSISDAARKSGIQVVVASNLNVTEDVKRSLNVVPVFRMSMYDRVVKMKYFSQLGNRLNGLVFAIRFFIDWKTSSLSHNLNAETFLFMPTATEVGTFGIIAWLRTRFKPVPIRTVILLRLDPRKFIKYLVRLMSPYLKKRMIMLATDSEQLANDFKAKTNEQFTVLPIPHLPVFSCNNSTQSSRENKPLRMLFLGGARVEKGIDTLVEAIAQLEKEICQLQLEFIIQCNIFLYEEETEAALEKLDRIDQNFGHGIRLVKDSLSTDEYYQLLLESDVVVIPYRRDAYKSRTSGIFAEALAAGKPVIVTEGTWMAAQMEQYGSGIIVKDGDAKDLVRAIQHFISSFDVLNNKARERGAEWTELHNADQVMKLLTEYWDTDRTSTE